MVAFVCHPYHRGGVTSWMVDAFREVQKYEPAWFITVDPVLRFFGGNRPLMVDLLAESGTNDQVITIKARAEFELGTIEYRAMVYVELIRKNVPPGATLISSDDEACWIACAVLASEYKNVSVLHADDDAYFRLLNKYAAYIAGYTSVSKRVQQKAVRSGRAISNVVIPCGIKMQDYKSAPVKNNEILWIGRVEEQQKRVSDIVNIALALRNKGVAFSIKVCGTGSEYEWLAGQLELQGLTNEVKLLGWKNKDEIAGLMANASVLLQTSNFEGMSVAVMEALASGCLVVSTRVSGVEDLETDAEAQNVVLLYDVGDVATGAQLVSKCLNLTDPVLPLQARAIAAKYYSIEGCMQAYRLFYDQLQPGTKALPLPDKIKETVKSMVLGNVRYLRWRIKH